MKLQTAFFGLVAAVLITAPAFAKAKAKTKPKAQVAAPVPPPVQRPTPPVAAVISAEAIAELGKRPNPMHLEQPLLTEFDLSKIEERLKEPETEMTGELGRDAAKLQYTFEKVKAAQRSTAAPDAGVALSAEQQLSRSSSQIMGMMHYQLALILRQVPKGLPAAVFSRLAEDATTALVGSYNEQLSFAKKVGVIGMMSAYLHGEGNPPSALAPKKEFDRYVEALSEFSKADFRKSQAAYESFAATVAKIDEETGQKFKLLVDSLQTTLYFQLATDWTTNRF